MNEVRQGIQDVLNAIDELAARRGGRALVGAIANAALSVPTKTESEIDSMSWQEIEDWAQAVEAMLPTEVEG